MNRWSAGHCIWTSTSAGRHFPAARLVGDYDLAALVEALPADQRPDMIACVVDGRTESWPRNLAVFSGPRLLLIGDSQNSPDGLSRLLAYAQKEPFDRIIFTHGCLDEPLFVAAGLKNVFWFPGLLCPVHDAWLPIIRQAEREAKLLSAGADFRAQFRTQSAAGGVGSSEDRFLALVRSRGNPPRAAGAQFDRTCPIGTRRMGARVF